MDTHHRPVRRADVLDLPSAPSAGGGELAALLLATGLVLLPAPGEAADLYISGGGGGGSCDGTAGGQYAGSGGSSIGGGGGGYVGTGVGPTATDGSGFPSYAGGAAGQLESLAGWSTTVLPGGNGNCGFGCAGAGGAASASTANNSAYDTIFVTGGDGTSIAKGGDARLEVNETLSVNTALNLTSGSGGIAMGGAASLKVVGTLIAPAITLKKPSPSYGGDLSFNVNNLEINDTGTTLTTEGLGTGDATIDTLRLTGSGNFTQTTTSGTAATIGSLTIAGGTINSGNFSSLIDGGVTYTTTDDITLDSGGAKFDTSGGNQTVSRVLTGAGSLTKKGTGTLTLSGTNDYIGGTTISTGTLALSGTGSIAASSGVTLADESTAIFDISNASDTTINGLTGGGTSGGKVNLGSKNLTISNNGANIYNGVIDGTGSLTKDGTGTLTLRGANTAYSGDTTVNGGLINFNGENNFGTTGAITLNGGGLQWASSTTTDISSRLATLGASGGTFDTNGNSVTFTTGFSGTGGLTKTGAGTLTLSGTNIFGATAINGGTLELAATGTLTSAVTVANTATLALRGSVTGNVTLAGSNSTLNAYKGSAITGDLTTTGGKLNFFLPETIDDGDFILGVSGTANITGSTINIQQDGSFTSFTVSPVVSFTVSPS
ncbi:hypothetical protein FACS189497_05200 [Betaproteobacteria bacterium]|nr:hypothetical protein FACS189497_05200 [Betaproteobacteria bacterium]